MKFRQATKLPTDHGLPSGIGLGEWLSAPQQAKSLPVQLVAQRGVTVRRAKLKLAMAGFACLQSIIFRYYPRLFYYSHHPMSRTLPRKSL